MPPVALPIRTLADLVLRTMADFVLPIYVADVFQNRAIWLNGPRYTLQEPGFTRISINTGIKHIPGLSSDLPWPVFPSCYPAKCRLLSPYQLIDVRA
ncbi:hypothetical protein ACEQ8H_008596 [Pleosporales sp. CAS-2024a]